MGEGAGHGTLPDRSARGNHDGCMMFRSSPLAVLNGVMTGSIYSLVALGLTMIYGVLHIINFAHGALLMLCMYAAYFLYAGAGLDPYAAIPVVAAGAFVVGYALQRFVIGKASHGRDEIILLVTLGLAIIIENGALFAFTANERLVLLPYDIDGIDLGITFLVIPQIAAFSASILITVLLWQFMVRTDMGKAIRAVAKERQGRAAGRHRCRAHIRIEFRHRHRLRRRCGLPSGADLSR